MKLPKTLQRYAAKIVDVEDDRGNQNGWWVHLADGWRNSNDPIGISHIIHEDTLAVCAQELRDAIPCDCTDCLAGLAKANKKTAATS
jgi:hypothetical protein